ncbi:MAG: hypothetical protein KAJ19_09210 [Gammaproteobacteria bacterium]|nr:hypothetical protein [Gammaproteobacteria bacterium]
MAINVHTDLNVGKLTKLFGLSESVSLALDNYDCAIEVTPKTVNILDAEGDLLASAKVKMGVLALAKDGTLGPLSKAVMHDELEKAYDKAYSLMVAKSVKDVTGDGEFVPPYHDYEHPEVKAKVLVHIVAKNKITAIKEHRTLTGASLIVAKDTVDIWWDEYWGEAQNLMSVKKSNVKKIKPAKGSVTVSAKESVMKGKPVSLRHATEVLQPIKGSSEKSVYYAIAIGGPVNVGCRIREDGYTSIRVEGLELASVTDKLALAGLTSAGDLHWSMHLNIEEKLMIRKAVGAILYAMALPFTKIAGDITPIIGEGV